MLRHLLSVIVTGLAVTLVLCDCARAQRFSRRRQSGQTFDQLEDVGTLQGNERFMRDNRNRRNFVGRDLDNMERFVGRLKGSLQQPANLPTDGVRRRIDRSQTINQPLSPTGPARNQIYYPRIELSGESREMLREANGSVESSVLGTLARSSRMPGSSRISVSVEGRTATLRGEVPSAGDRDLAEVLLSFEPGISSIQNQLSVNPRLEPGPGSLQAWRNRELEDGESWGVLSQGAASEASERSTWESLSVAADAS